MKDADMASLLPLDDALALLTKIPPAALNDETVALSTALGRVLAEQAIAPFDMPRFNNSAVDGYAVAGDLVEGGKFMLIGTSSAGEPFSDGLKPGEAVRIATGAVLPNGTEAVAMQEDCTIADSTVTIGTTLLPAMNCRRAGQDVAAETMVLPAGRLLSAPDLSMLTALGIMQPRVKRKLRVAIASTGSELVEDTALQAGQIYDSNRPLLKAILESYPVEIVDLGILPDDVGITRDSLQKAAKSADLILTTGGVSVGARDYVRETIESEGEVIFWRLAIRPGKPLLLGRVGKTPLLGLPGNPVSTYVTFNLVCRPLLYRLMGLPAPSLMRIPVQIGVPYCKSATLREFARVSVIHEGAQLTAMPFRSQLSNLISSLLESDGLLDLPVGRDIIKAGEIFDFIPWTAFTTL